jgi:hypothetical protein
MARVSGTGPRLLLALLALFGLGLLSAAPAMAAVSMTVSQTTDLNPKGTKVSVQGQGFTPGIQLYVVTCNPAIPNGGACDLANFSQVDVAADGSWSADVKVVATFGSVDCLKVGCAIQTSRVGKGADRTQEAIVPIMFTGQTAPMASAPPAASASPSESSSASATVEPTDPASPVATPAVTNVASDSTDSGGSSAALWIVIVVVIVVLAGGGIWYARRDSSSNPS